MWRIEVKLCVAWTSFEEQVLILASPLTHPHHPHPVHMTRQTNQRLKYTKVQKLKCVKVQSRQFSSLHHPLHTLTILIQFIWQDKYRLIPLKYRLIPPKVEMCESTVSSLHHPLTHPHHPHPVDLKQVGLFSGPLHSHQ